MYQFWIWYITLIRGLQWRHLQRPFIDAKACNGQVSFIWTGLIIRRTYQITPLDGENGARQPYPWRSRILRSEIDAPDYLYIMRVHAKRVQKLFLFQKHFLNLKLFLELIFTLSIFVCVCLLSLYWYCPRSHVCSVLSRILYSPAGQTPSSYFKYFC